MKKRNLFFGILFVLLVVGLNVWAFRAAQSSQKTLSPILGVVNFAENESQPIIGAVDWVEFHESEVPVIRFRPVL